MSINKDDEKELRRLIGLASDGFLLGWLVDLHESLSDVCDEISETYSRLDDLQHLLSSNKLKLTRTDQQNLALLLKRVVAFNNRSVREKTAFDAVGLGSCATDAEICIEAVKKALNLVGAGNAVVS